MTWILSAFGVIIFFSLMYIFIRSSRTKIEVEVQTFSIFVIGTIFYFIYNILMNISFSIDLTYLLLILLTAALFSLTANFLSFKAMSLAPNPGYSLMITKSHAILTMILANIFFQSEITLKNSIAIFIVLLSLGISLTSKKENKNSKQIWIVYALIAFFAFAFQSIMLTFLTRNNLEISLINFYLFFFLMLFMGCILFYKKIKIDLTKQKLTLMVGMGISSALGNLFMVLGFSIAPNPGYISAASASTASLMMILSYFIFKDQLTSRKIIGAIGVTIGLILLFI